MRPRPSSRTSRMRLRTAAVLMLAILVRLVGQRSLRVDALKRFVYAPSQLTFVAHLALDLNARPKEAVVKPGPNHGAHRGGSHVYQPVHIHLTLPVAM